MKVEGEWQEGRVKVRKGEQVGGERDGGEYGEGYYLFAPGKLWLCLNSSQRACYLAVLSYHKHSCVNLESSTH